MKKIIAVSLVVIALLAIAVLPSMASVESEIRGKMGTASSEAKFDVNVNAPATYKPGSQLSVVVTIDNVRASEGISLVEFVFNYDASKLTLTNSSTGGTLNCITKVPNGDIGSADWENFCHIAGTGAIGVGFGTTKLVTESGGFVAKNNGDFTFTFNFNVSSDAEGDLGFYVAHNTVTGASNVSDAMNIYDGKGSYDITAKYVEATSKPVESKPDVSVPDTSKPNTSKPDTSKPDTSKPDTSIPDESDSDVEGDDESDGIVSGSEDVSDGVSDEASNESGKPETSTDKGNGNVSDGSQSGGKDSSSKADSDKNGSENNGDGASSNNIVPIVIAIAAVLVAAGFVVFFIIKRKNVQ